MPHAVANGKVLLAYAAIPIRARLERYTDRAITSADTLAAELASVRRNGYATAAGELETGLVAAAVPVFGSAGGCIAALSVSGPDFRLDSDTRAIVASPQHAAKA
jgi:DNA-binding IclR family transcriptional regulator